MTLAELITDFRLRTGDVNPEYMFSDAQITSFANQAVTEAAIRSRLLFDTEDVTLTANTKRYTLNPVVFKVDSAVLTEPTVLDAELLTTAGWTVTAGWTESPDDTFAHASGTTALSHSAVIETAIKYRLSWTVTGRTAGSFAVAIGGQSQAANTASGTVDFTTTTADAFTITPTTDFDGTISLASVKRIISENIKSDITLTDRATLDAKMPGWRLASASKPMYMIVEESGYEMFPAPDDAYILTTDYYRTPLTPMVYTVTTGTPEINARHHDGLIDWMVHLAMLVKDIDTESMSISGDEEQKFIRRFGIREDANVMRKQARKGGHTTRAIRF